MNRHKRRHLISIPIIAAAVISLPAFALDNSLHSVTVIPAEGNGRCSDYGANDFVKEMGDSISCPGDNSGTVTGPDGETADWSYNCTTNELSFSNSSIGINYTVTKTSRNITWYTYGSGTWKADAEITNQNPYTAAVLPMGSFALCYGLPSSDNTVESEPFPDCSSEEINAWLGAINCTALGDGTVVTLWQPPNPEYPNSDRLFQCICNDSGTIVSEDCDPSGDSGDLRPCYTKDNGQFKATTIVEFDADPTVCTTVGNVRTCKWVPPLF